MSGTDFTQTPNYGLYKPLPSADINQWGSHLNLNADTLDGLMHGFLPLSGGTVTGATTFAGGTDASKPWIYAHQNVVGTTPAGQASWYVFNIDNDAADATNAQGGGAHGTYFGHNIVTGAKGGRTAVSVLLNQTSATISPTGTYYVALGAFSQVNASAGGTSGSPLGALFGLNTAATIATGSGNWFSAVGMEVDVAVQAGNTVDYKAGVSVVQWNGDATRGRVDDCAIGIAMGGLPPTAPGWTTGLQFGQASGWWPFTATSTMIGTRPGLGGGPAMLANIGVDLSAVTFSGAAFKSVGFAVDGSGYTSPLLANAANDAAAATAGVPIGAMYRNGNAVQVRLT